MATAPREVPLPIRVRKWRESMKLTREQLSERTGYPVETIAGFETGHILPSESQIGGSDWRRFKLACAAVAAGVEFDWEPRQHLKVVRT